MEELNQINKSEMERLKSEMNNLDNPNIETPKKDGKVGPIIGSMIIIAVIVIGGIYYFNQSINKVAKTPVEEEIISDVELGEIDTALQEIENEIDNAVNQ